ncbi:MAG: PP2C family protein-serine/threonine phosphatase, partial [Acidimicrobiales bacterium]
HQIIVANAGHPPPLLLCDDAGEFVTTSIGVPVGVSARPAYTPVTLTVPARATLLAFTDGLVERRGESLDAGFSRLHDVAVGARGSLEEFMTLLIAQLASSSDDTALLGVRWQK